MHAPKEKERRDRSKRGRSWIPIAATCVILAVVAVVLWQISALRPAPDEAPSSSDVVDAPTSDAVVGKTATCPTVGRTAPDFTLRSLDGEPVTLSEFRGRIVILDFWASWCSPCQRSFPALHALWSAYANRGVELIGVSLDRSESSAKGFLSSTGYTNMIALWESRSASSAVATTYCVGGIPHTFVIDEEGVVQYSGHPARLTVSDLESILN